MIAVPVNHVTYAPNGDLSDWIAAQFPADYAGWGIDVGASDGISISTTYLLEKQRSWTILCVEANDDFLTLLRKHRAWTASCALGAEIASSAAFYVNRTNPESYSALEKPDHPEAKKILTSDWDRRMVKLSTVDRQLERWEFPRLDLLAIDVEGTEQDVLAGCSLTHWQPRVIVVESWEPRGHDEYLKGLGYRHVWRTVHNDCYVRGPV